MTEVEEPAARRRRSAAMWCLAAGQTIGYAGLHYIFAALLLSWERDLGWSKTDLTLAFTVAILVSAVSTTYAGRLVDMGYGRQSLSYGILAGGIALPFLVVVQTPLQFLLVWVAVGAAQGACLYQTCFALIVRAYGARARATIVRITLVGGLASPIAFPVCAWLAATWGWKAAVLAFAAALAFVAAPLLHVGASLLEADADAGEADATVPEPGRAVLRRVGAHPAFWLIALAFAALAANYGMLMGHIVPMLVDHGLTAALAVTVASVVGPMQIAGRFGLMVFDRHLDDRMLALAALAAAALSSGLLLVAGAPLVTAVAFAALQGAAFGINNIVRPLLTAHYLGRAAFGAIAALVAIPGIVGYALGPYVGSLLWQAGGYQLMITIALAIAVAGAACVVVLFAVPPRVEPEGQGVR